MEPSPQREAECVEQRGNELEAPGAPGVGLVIGSELVNPDPVSNSLCLFMFSLVCTQQSLLFPLLLCACMCVCVCVCVRVIYC
jgi:hypothetical protein